MITGVDTSVLITVPTLFLAVAGAAFAREPDAEVQAEMLVERDRLIDHIARGVDLDRSVKRFAALRAEVLGKRDAEEPAKGRLRAMQDTQRDWKAAYRKTSDYEVSWRCTLSVDPAHPVPSTEGRFKGDWGKVVRREVIRLPPKNALDDGEQITMVEVVGKLRAYLLRDEKYGPDRHPVGARVGDLVLVCDGGSGVDRREPMPPQWSGPVQQSGFAVRVARPPKIAEKARWNPIHVTGTKFFWAIRDVKWTYPPEAFVLSNIEIEEDLGGGHYRIDANQGLSWVLEVPPGVKRRELLVPGRSLWVIMGQARFDRGLKKLVLVAEDVEERYVIDP
ncbi:MAG: hypothetical protein EXR72_20820 [Myxococcales bacterium]|nr:hypothetical protein [Myxococcales bacterium]